MKLDLYGLSQVINRTKTLQHSIEPIVNKCYNKLLKDIRDQAMTNLRQRLLGTTYSRGSYSNRMPLTDNLDAWEITKTSPLSWTLTNISEHAAPVEFGSRTQIKPKSPNRRLYLGNNTFVKSVKGQSPKHFLGDALYYQKDKWRQNLQIYFSKNIQKMLV
jgi:hypothetical protein